MADQAEEYQAPVEDPGMDEYAADLGAPGDNMGGGGDMEGMDDGLDDAGDAGAGAEHFGDEEKMQKR